jgi:hypothetical protein
VRAFEAVNGARLPLSMALSMLVGACVPGGAAQRVTLGSQARDAGGPPRDGAVAADDAEARDGAEQDAGAVDAGAVDAGAVDAGAVDGGAVGPRPVTGRRGATPNGVRHIYSQLQAWTSDALYFLAVDINTPDGQGVVLLAETLEEVARVGHAGQRWVTGTHQVLSFDDRRNTGAALYAFDVDTGEETELLRLGHPGLRAGRSQEELDHGGRWVAVYIDQATSGGPRIVTADVIERRVGADVSIAELGCDFEPDWVGIDPTGRFLLVQSVRSGRGPCSGLWVHDVRTGQPLRQITDHRNHGSNGLDPDGHPYFLSTELTHPDDNGRPGIYRYYLEDARREVVGPPLPWGALGHVSCLGGPGAPCMVSGGDEFPGELSGQIWRLDFDGTRTALEAHRAQGCDYWGQPQATVGPGGRYAFVTHGGDCARIHSVVID